MSTQGFISAAESLVEKTPYLFGGITPAGLDCSGLVYWAAGTQGVAVPRTTQGEWSGLMAVSTPIPGDLILFDVPSDGPPQPQHVGIYLAPNTMVSAPHTGLYVSYSTIPNESDISIMGYRRINFGTPAPTPSPITDFLEELLMDPMFAVRYLYRFALHREVDAVGFSTWVNYLQNGGTLNNFLAALQDSDEGRAVLAGSLRPGV